MAVSNFLLTLVGVGAIAVLLRGDIKQTAGILRRNVRQIRVWLEEEQLAGKNAVAEKPKELDLPKDQSTKLDKQQQELPGMMIEASSLAVDTLAPRVLLYRPHLHAVQALVLHVGAKILRATLQQHLLDVGVTFIAEALKARERRFVSVQGQDSEILVELPRVQKLSPKDSLVIMVWADRPLTC